jgi:hypothetical protein
MKAEKQALLIDYLLFSICYFCLWFFAHFDFDFFCHRFVHNGWIIEPPFAFCVFTAHKMPTAGAFMFDFAGCGNFYSFTQPFMGFLLWHQLFLL